MSRDFNRLRDRVNDLEETLLQIRGAVALVAFEHLADVIPDTEQGRQLRRILINIEKIANPRRQS
ncbi:hypothetical protein ACIBI9_04095 [Nonomuraea sp. NPDC050451]|uniref:hypothetical protein n=1 Tax=Nonomuraea sp. NPDC050451 TaxID=3364364 RepID=UPI0037B67A43